MNKENIVKKLQSRLNFAPSEAEAYYCMLTEDQTAANLSTLLKLNRSYVYGVLKKMIEKGFCLEINGVVRKYRAVKPSLAFKSTIDDLNDRVKDINEFSDSLEPFYKERVENRTHETIKVLYSKAHILDTLNRYEHEAQEEILAFSKPPYLMDIYNFQKYGKSQSESTTRGVQHKTVYEMGEVNLAHLEMLKQYIKSGEEVRIAKVLPMKLVIFDSKIVVFTLERKIDVNADLTFTSFNDTVLASSFKLIFQMYWDSALTYEEYIKQNSIKE